jgi:hypothetical protein
MRSKIIAMRVTSATIEGRGDMGITVVVMEGKREGVNDGHYDW